MPYRSNYELKAFNILENDSNTKNYSYETLKIRYRNSEGKVSTYYPDIVVNNNKIIEVKAKWVIDKKDENTLQKFAAAEKWAKKNGYTFEVWTEKGLRLLES